MILMSHLIFAFGCYFHQCFVIAMIKLKGMHWNHDFNVVVGKQCRTENA